MGAMRAAAVLATLANGLSAHAAPDNRPGDRFSFALQVGTASSSDGLFEAPSLAEAGPSAVGATGGEEKIPSDVTEAELSDAASKSSGEGNEPGNGD